MPDVIQISNNQFGKDYVTKHYLKQIIKNKKQCPSKVAIDENNHVLGYYIGWIIKNEEIEDVLKLSPDIFNNAKEIGVLKTIAVSKKSQGLGVGSKLTKTFIKDLKKIGITTVCTVAWKSIKGINIEKLVTRLKFKPALEIPNYWKDYSEKTGYHCPICGIPCRCHAVIYILKNED